MMNKYVFFSLNFVPPIKSSNKIILKLIFKINKSMLTKFE